MVNSWVRTLSELQEKGVPCVLITVTEVKGSTPREAGVKMVVAMESQYGTIGGGNLEFQAVNEARRLLANDARCVLVKSYALGPELSQCCGGRANILFEPFVSDAREILLFGAGHVGKEIIKVLDGLPVQIKWIDDRESEFPREMPPNVRKIVASSPLDALEGLSEKSYVVILTHSHAHDYALARAALKNGRFAYLGMIGSKTKRARFSKRLVADGVAEGDLQKLHCPIGVEGIEGKHPREIAISLAAQLLKMGIVSHSTVDDTETVDADIGCCA